MAELTIAVRFLHLAASLLPLGIFAFVCWLERPALRMAGVGESVDARAFEQRLWRIVAWSLGVAFVTSVAGLALQAANMTGLPLRQSLTLDTLAAALGTQYGKVWLLRLVLPLILAGISAVLIRSDRPQRLWAHAGLIVAGAFVACLSLASHAAAGEGTALVWQLASDAVHVLAAGLWLGALVPLAMLLAWCRRLATPWSVTLAKEATRRFSFLGVATVVTLLITGIYNAWQLVGDIPPLLGTAYGQLLLIKLALLAAILTLAATNLLSLRPRMLAGRDDSFSLMQRLQRNAWAEAGIGAAILLIVAMLGVTAPARHVQPDWPFTFRYSWEINKKLPDKRFGTLWGKTYPEQGTLILVGAGFASLALLSLGYAIVRRRYRVAAVVIGVAALAEGAALALPALVVDAYPTTYRRPAVPYQAISIHNGLQAYPQLCVSCHGIGGFGDGPAGASLKPKPADLTARHTGDHTAGDLFWWLTHGKKDTAMPGFQQQLSEEARWDMINFLRALSAAEQARQMAPLVEPPWLVAPDFVYRTLAGTDGSLKAHRGQNVVLLVLFTWPQSQPRLTQLAGISEKLAAAGATVIAVPSDAAALDANARPALDALRIDPVMDGSPETFGTYAVFRRSLSAAGTQPDPPIPPHMEFLIDKQGYVRARWIAGESRGWSNTDLLLREIAQLNQEKPTAPAPDDHVH